MENNMSTCANCGKGEEDANKLKTCNACKMVKYCNSSCQREHTVPTTKRNVRSVLPSCMRKLYSNNLHQMKSVQSA